MRSSSRPKLRPREAGGAGTSAPPLQALLLAVAGLSDQRAVDVDVVDDALTRALIGAFVSDDLDRGDRVGGRHRRERIGARLTDPLPSGSARDRSVNAVDAAEEVR